MPQQPANWDIYVLEYARSKDQPWVDLISGMYKDGVMDLPFSFILARNGDRNVLVDTGFMQDDHSSGFSRKFGIPSWISPLRMLGELGVEAGAVSDIFVTHAHFDNMGSIRGSAAALEVHENTIRYRLSRIEELTGLAVMHDPDAQLRARLSLLVLLLQGRLPTGISTAPPALAAVAAMPDLEVVAS